MLNRRRDGFSIVELIVVMTVLAALGLALTQLLLAEGRFSDQQAALRGARAVSRQAMNVVLSELRMVQDSGGIDSASTDGKTIRVIVPYLFGLNCGASGTTKNVASMLPADSLTLVQAVYRGYGWRGSNGRYTLVWPTTPLGSDSAQASTTATKCTSTSGTNAGIRAATIAGRTGRVLDLRPQSASAPQGQAVFLFQRVTYSFKASTAIAGRFGLWRQAEGGTDEELVAPFDSLARFKYWAEDATVSVASPPDLHTIRGLDIVFAGVSSYVPQGRTTVMKSTIVTSVFFRNLRSY